MPRYYFYDSEGARFVPDSEGLEFPDIGVAEREAAEAAAAIGRDLLPKGLARSDRRGSESAWAARRNRDGHAGG